MTEPTATDIAPGMIEIDLTAPIDPTTEARAILLGFVAFCGETGIPVHLDKDGEIALISTTSGHSAFVTTVQSALYISIPLISDATTDEEREEAIALLHKIGPLEAALSSLADYSVLSDGSVGLLIWLPMPLRFSDILTEDILLLVANLLSKSFFESEKT